VRRGGGVLAHGQGAAPSSNLPLHDNPIASFQAAMDFLWDEALQLNTVAVYDVARALYFLAKKVEPGRSEYNT
jgi:hypothetical protein